MPTNFDNDAHFGKIYWKGSSQTMALLELSGKEAINEISTFKLRGYSVSPLDLSDFIGSGIRIALQTGEKTYRNFHQIIFSAHDLGQIYAGEQELYLYEFALRPWIWAASHVETSRIFHKSPLEKILRSAFEVVTRFPGCRLDYKVDKPPPQLEYTVQFNETDLNFGLRLLEEFGLNYHCKMEESGHAIVISDSVRGFDDIQGMPRAHLASSAMTGFSEAFSSWLPQRNFTTGKTRTLDYNFKNKGNQPSSNNADTKSYAVSDLESFHYTGRIQEKSVGDDIAKRRLAALRMDDSLVLCDGIVPSLGAGMKVDVIGVKAQGEDGYYVCLSANHNYVHGEFRSNSASDNVYDGSYVLTRENAPIAPKRTAASSAATMKGPQTAIVMVGAHDDVDEYGRIKVRFPWQSDTSDSMYCRVSQMWAGSKWGTVFIPQAGMEVIVEFLNGHFDYPIITGCLYNAKNMPPWPLPGEKKISGIKTVTENQFSFDDTKGSELIEMIGTKDLKVTIKNDANEEVKANETRIVGGEFKETVDGSITIESKKKITFKVGGSTIEMDATSIKLTSASISVEGKADVKVAAPQIDVNAKMALTTKGGISAEHSASGIMTIKGSMVMIN